jgi:hypothetical protein
VGGQANPTRRRRVGYRPSSRCEDDHPKVPFLGYFLSEWGRGPEGLGRPVLMSGTTVTATVVVPQAKYRGVD